ncbi:MAG: hypothetical protein P9M14_10975 [Candidatus Alcyoniella australis]|nr:hypothetical protein [Candidatus Alcyoniella australis]
MSSRAIYIVVFSLLTALLLAASCGSGSSGDDDDDDDSEVLGTLAGTIQYDGDAVGEEIVIGLINEWPMTSPPQQFIRVTVPDGGFPMAYEIELNYVGDYFLASFLDVDPMDGVAMNSEIDPMDMPDEGETKQTLVQGVNQRDFTLLDPEDVDFWWQ